MSASSSNTALVVYLSGARRGETERIGDDVIHLGLDDHGRVDAAPSDEKLAGKLLAVLRREDDGYRVAAPGRGDVRLHDRPADGLLLHPTELLTVGPEDALVRIRPHAGGRPYKRLGEALEDCTDCARHGDGGMPRRLWLLIIGLHHEMWSQVSPLTRWTPPVLIVGLAIAVGMLWGRNLRLERALGEQSARVEALVMSVPDVGERERFGDELGSLRDELLAARGRLAELEQQAGARTRAIAAAANSVVFLQGAYGFVEPQSREPLREAIGRFPGEVGVRLGGTGEVFEIRYTGTGFVASPQGHVITNRHVAIPWEFDETSARLMTAGFEPVMRRLQGYLPGQEHPFEVTVLDAHDAADVAVLACGAESTLPTPLELAEGPVALGTEVIVLGYPTGMQALLARAAPEFLEVTFQAGALDFWETAERLAAAGYVTPLVTVGVVGQSTPTSLVYDAETTHGGSGGPVIGLDGKVVAINARIVPGFAGSNLGVPAAYARELLDRVAASELPR